MEPFAPDLSRFWQPRDAASDVADGATERDVTPAEERALEELAERVSAARRTV